MSLPTGERGLKYYWFCCAAIAYYVAPYRGAWIEINDVAGWIVDGWVAPYRGAWIEID